MEFDYIIEIVIGKADKFVKKIDFSRTDFFDLRCCFKKNEKESKFL